MFSKKGQRPSSPEVNLDFDEAIVDQYFSVQKHTESLDLAEEDSVAQFVEELKKQSKGHMPKPSGRVIFDSQDQNIQPIVLRRQISDVSVGDIQMQRTQKIDDFLSTRQLTLLNMPMTIADLFEFLAACDMDPLFDTTSCLWTVLKFLNLLDLLNLRQVCKSSCQLVPASVQQLSVQLGTNMIGDLRVALWQVQCQSLDIENNLKIRMGIGSVFANVYDEMKLRLHKLDPKVQKQIVSDLSKTDLSQEQHLQLKCVLECISYIFPQLAQCLSLSKLVQVVHSQTQDVELTVGIMSGLIVSKQLSGLFTDQQPELKIRLFVLDHVIQQLLPALHSHFKRNNFTTEFFAQHWMSSLLCGFLNQDVAASVLDNFMLQGWPFVYRIVVSVLTLLEQALLECKDIYDLNDTIINAKQLNVFANLQMIDIDYQEVELSFFVNKVQQKLKSNLWTVLDRKLLPTLQSRIDKRAKPIQQEIQKRSIRIQKQDQLLRTKQPRLKQLKVIYNDSQDMYEMHREKLDCFTQTLLQLKHESHTLKQTLKMKQNSISLKQKQIKFNVTQLQAQGLSREEITKRVQFLTPKIAQFDSEQCRQNINMIEGDIVNIGKRLAQQEALTKTHLQAWQDAQAKYEAELLECNSLETQKERLVQSMNDLIEQVEDDHRRVMQEVGRAYQQVHITQYYQDPLVKQQDMTLDLAETDLGFQMQIHQFSKK